MATLPISPRHSERSKRLLRRLDSVSSQINPFLLAVAIGLVILDATCLGALMVRLPDIHLRVCVMPSPPAVSHAPSR